MHFAGFFIYDPTCPQLEIVAGATFFLLATAIMSPIKATATCYN